MRAAQITMAPYGGPSTLLSCGVCSGDRLRASLPTPAERAEAGDQEGQSSGARRGDHWIKRDDFLRTTN